MIFAGHWSAFELHRPTTTPPVEGHQYNIKDLIIQSVGLQGMVYSHQDYSRLW